MFFNAAGHDVKRMSPTPPSIKLLQLSMSCDTQIPKKGSSVLINRVLLYIIIAPNCKAVAFLLLEFDYLNVSHTSQSLLVGFSKGKK